MLPSGAIAEPSRRVLLIESSPLDRQVLRNWLRVERIEVYEASDIISGLGACSKFRPDLILLQLRLPTLDGFEVLRRLKEDPRARSIPVIFLTSIATTTEKARGIDMGAIDFLARPYDPVEVVARVNSALRIRAYMNLLEHRAHLDGLTELGNRFALEERLQVEWEVCRRERRALAVTFVDLDHFKAINDQHGHAAGDLVLRQAAQVLNSSVRDDDFLARYGGEEFVVLTAGCDLAGAVLQAERFRGRLAEAEITYRTLRIPVTASIGVAVFQDLSNKAPSELLEQADQTLYQAKAGGRNAVWVFDPTTQAPASAQDWMARGPVASATAT